MRAVDFKSVKMAVAAAHHQLAFYRMMMARKLKAGKITVSQMRNV